MRDLDTTELQARERENWPNSIFRCAYQLIRGPGAVGRLRLASEFARVKTLLRERELRLAHGDAKK